MAIKPVNGYIPSTETEWWSRQRGVREGSSYLTPAAWGRYIAVLGGVEPTRRVLVALRKYASARALSLPALRRHALAGGELLLIDPAPEMPRPAVLAELEALGICVEFRPAGK